MGEVSALTEREKETLRRLSAGHDAKSTAQSLGLSVHTVNERLREARRKLGVSSSRQAARLLAEAEGVAPNFSGDSNFLGDKQIGVAATGPDLTSDGPSIKRRAPGLPLAWLAGGMLIMSVIVAAVAAAAIFGATTASQGPGAAPAPAAAAPETAETRAARDWLALVDQQRWGDSWDAAGAAFQSLPKAR